jgi:anti-sigma regulatory factor (Ser/Thr protein kinase)
VSTGFPALDPWSTVLLYTDGLVEGPDLPLGDGLEGLRQSIQGAPRDPDALCGRVLDSIDARAGSRDDLALLAIQLRPPGDTLALELSARPSSLVSMRRGLAHWLRLAGAAEDEVYEVLVACGEACANTVAHAHPAIMDSLFEVRATRSGREIEVVVSDSGQWRGSGEAPPGRGLALMRALMDEVDIDTGSRGTTVTLRRRLRDATSA